MAAGIVVAMDSTTIVIALLAGAACLVVGILLGQQLAERRRGELGVELQALTAQAVAASQQQVFDQADSRLRATELVMAPVKETLGKLSERLNSLETSEAGWRSMLRQQIESVRVSGQELRRETQALSTALRQPQVRGHWGEMQLKRSLELAGITSRCVYDEQVTRQSDDGRLRPDVVVTLAGGKSVVIDAKTPLDAFLAATQCTEPEEQQAELIRHVRQVRSHIDSLAAKSYWQQFDPTPEFVVMFLPGEALFAQAVDTDPSLIDYAAGKGVVLATPTTLIAMLKTVAYAWKQEALAENARDVTMLGRELYDRLTTVGSHLDKLGRALTTAVASYNKTVGSLESRVLVSARKMRDLKVSDQPLDQPAAVTECVQPLTAPELVADEAVMAIEGAPGREQWTRPAVGE